MANPVFSAYRANSDHVFSEIARLYLKKEATVADLTYGQGNWWKKIPKSDYQLHPRDLANGQDARKLPFAANTVDAVCFDPPFLRRASTVYLGQSRFRKNYRFEAIAGIRTHDDLLHLYDQVAHEAWRVLHRGGRFIVKCQDAVVNSVQRFTHVELLTRFTAIGFRGLDLFVLVQPAPPRVPPQNRHQRFARKNHSFFLIMEKPRRQRRRCSGAGQGPATSQPGATPPTSKDHVPHPAT